MESYVNELVETTDLLFFETPMGKAILDENSPNYGGCYSEFLSVFFLFLFVPDLPSIAETSLALQSAPTRSPLSASWSRRATSSSRSVACKATLTLARSLTTSRSPTPSSCTQTALRSASRPSSPPSGPSYRAPGPCSFTSHPSDGSPFSPARLLIKRLAAVPKKQGSRKANDVEQHADSQRKQAVVVPDAPSSDEAEKWGKDAITQEFLWPRMAHFFREWDVIVAETGTSAFGILDIPYPKTAMSLAQVPSCISLYLPLCALLTDLPILNFRSCGDPSAGPSVLLSERPSLLASRLRARTAGRSSSSATAVSSSRVRSAPSRPRLHRSHPLSCSLMQSKRSEQ